jgi:hypothetical protein
MSTQVFNANLAFDSNLPANGHKITGLANGTASGDAAAYGQLKVLQVVSFETTTAFTTTSNTFQTSTTLASITPSSSSNKVLVLVTGVIRNSNPSAAAAYVSLFRGSTNLGGGSDAAFVTINGQAQLTSSFYMNGSFSYLDSPATTSSTTYAVKIMNDNNSTSVSFNIAQRSSIILLEVAP